MGRALKIFLITFGVLLASDISVSIDHTSSSDNKNQCYKATRDSASIIQLTDLETETETQDIIRNTSGAVFEPLTINYSFVKASQQNPFLQHPACSSCPVFILQHKLII
ncbi:MAG TPA: hypothetical protein VIM65_23350 [Cyclobacteriaceae bacterium]